MIEFKRFALSVFAVGSLFFSPQAWAQQSSNGNESQGSSGYNWNGFYGGGNLGGGFGGSDFLSSLGRGFPFFEGELYPGQFGGGSGNPNVIAAYSSNSASFSSVTGGLQGGYNWRLGGYLFGIEIDINALDGRNAKTTQAFGFTRAGGTTLYTFHNEMDANYIFSARPRLGMMVGSGVLYATGGLAVTTLKYKHSMTATGGEFNGLNETASFNETKVGWTAGAGYEFPLTSTMTLKAEYLFTAFGEGSTNDNKIFPLNTAAFPSFSVADAPCGADLGGDSPRQCFKHKADLLLHTIRLGVNFKF